LIGLFALAVVSSLKNVSWEGQIQTYCNIYTIHHIPSLLPSLFPWRRAHVHHAGGHLDNCRYYETKPLEEMLQKFNSPLITCVNTVNQL
jgi:hypothetical protein